MDKSGAKKEPEPKINNFGSATLLAPLFALIRVAKKRKRDSENPKK